MQQDARDKLPCCTFPQRLASELKADLRQPIRQKRVRRSNALIGWSNKKELMHKPKGWTIFGQYP